MMEFDLWPKSLRVVGGPPGVLAITSAVLVAAALGLAFNLVQLKGNFAWVEHSNEVLAETARLERALLQAESSERGYLLTTVPAYLESYDQAKAETPAALDALVAIIGDNPEQFEKLGVLRNDIAERFAEYDEALKAGPSQIAQALVILQSARARGLTPRIQTELSDFGREERRLLSEREQAVTRGGMLVAVLIVVLCTLAFISVGLGAYLFEHQRVIPRLKAANEDLIHSREDLAQREAYLRAILATIPDAMVIIDERGAIQSMGATAERLFGVSLPTVRGHNVSILMPQPFRDAHDSYIVRYLSTGEPHVIGRGRVVVGQRSDGTTFPMELSVGEIQLAGRREFVGFVRDLTIAHERERLLRDTQNELSHMSRISSMGEMASSLAHELNQPLAAITNYLNASRRLLERIPGEHLTTITGMLSKAAEQALRAGGVITRLRDFLGRGDTERRVESLRKMIEEATALALLVASGELVQIESHFDPAADLVLVDKIQIQQVILNLLRNAIEALENAPRREIKISTRSEDDGMAVVEVRDTGNGIASEIMERLFQPFTTTKPAGMGIGLSISRTIIEAHGGRISVTSNDASGTCFRFTLQKAQPDNEEETI